MPTSTLAIGILMLPSFLLLTSCVDSPNPAVEDLIKIAPPTFNESHSSLISTPSIDFALTGSCDTQAYLTEYRLDEDEGWTQVECKDGSFSIALKVQGFVKVWARSRGKFTYTDASTATVRFLLPPTSDTVAAVSSSKADSSDRIRAGTQNVVGHTFEGNSAASGTLKVDHYSPRLVYETP